MSHLIQARPYFKDFTTDLNASGFTAKVATTTKPTIGNGVYDLTSSFGTLVPKKLMIVPYGLGSANDVYDLRVWKWTQVGSGPKPGILWVPTLITMITVTLGAATGVAGSPVLDTELFADTLVLNKQAKFIDADSGGVSNRGKILVYSPADDTIAYFITPTYGAMLIELDIDQTTQTPQANALVQPVC